MATIDFIDTQEYNDIMNAKLAAQAAKGFAEAAQALAETAELNAGTAETNAIAAKNTAVDAKNTAVAAKDTAVSAKDIALAAQLAAELALDSLDDRYLGAKATDPATDNDGNALAEGATYWNTVSKHLKMWNGTAWAVPLTPVQAMGQSTTDVMSQAATSLIQAQLKNWPIKENGLTVNYAGKPTRDQLQGFLLDLHLTGTKGSGLTYSCAAIKRNSGGAWAVNVFSATGTPGTVALVAGFSTTSDPEIAGKASFHALTANGSSGISGIVAVDWSKIDVGSYSNMYDYNGFGLDDMVWDLASCKLVGNYSILQEMASYPDFDTFLSKDATTLKLTNTKINTNNYIHPRGTSEYAGNSTYSQTALGVYLEPQGAKLLVKRLKFKIWGNSSFAGTVKVMTGTTRNADPSSHTLIETFAYDVGQFNATADTFSEVILSNDLILLEAEYLYIYVEKTAGTITLQKWNVQATDPARNYIIYKTTTWNFGVTSYIAVPMLVYSDIDNEGLGVRVTNSEAAIASNLDRIVDLETAVGTAIEISLPDTIYAIVGDTLQLFFRGMLKAKNLYDYDILVTCSKGSQYPRYFEYTPTATDIGTTTFTIQIKNDVGSILGTKTVNLITKAAVQSPASPKKVLCIGDSLTSLGTWCIEAYRRLTGIGGSPAGLGLSNINFLGRKTGSGIGWEGNGGWTWSSYSTAGVPAYKFTVSGVVTPPAIGAVYTNNGGIFTVAEVNLTLGSGYIRCTNVGTPASSGTLTKSSGTGDSTLTFSASEADAGNPFWGTGSLDFASYVATYMGGQCDIIYFLLTWNGITANQTDFSAMITTAKLLIDHVHTNFPDTEIKVMGIQLPSLNGGMGANYGADGTGYADVFGMIKTAINMNKAYQDWCNEVAYSSYLEFVNVSSQFDSENNMQEADRIVNTRSAKTEKRGTNGVHPDTPGYYQIGDVVYRNFVANYCQ